MEGKIAIPTRNGRIRAIKNFSKYLEAESLTSEDVFRKIKQHKDTKRVVEVLFDGEKKRLIGAVKPDTWVGARMMVIVALLIDTGMRVSELAGIQIEDIDYKQRRIKLHGKGDKYRFVPIGPALGFGARIDVDIMTGNRSGAQAVRSGSVCGM
jgi:site-specific recombinase XerD